MKMSAGEQRRQAHAQRLAAVTARQLRQRAIERIQERLDLIEQVRMRGGGQLEVRLLEQPRAESGFQPSSAAHRRGRDHHLSAANLKAMTCCWRRTCPQIFMVGVVQAHHLFHNP